VRRRSGLYVPRFDSVVIGTSPLRYYKLSDGSGATTAVDAMGNGNGTYQSAATPSSDGVAFTGAANSWISLATTGLPSGNSKNSVMWVGTCTNNAAQRDAVSLGTNLSNQVSGSGISSAANFAVWQYWTGSNVPTAANAVVTGVEHMVHIVYNQSNITIYVNGVQKVQTAKSSHNIVYGTARIGISPTSGTGNWIGSIRRVAIWNTELSSTDVAAMWANRP
jgi:hypothetical protein